MSKVFVMRILYVCQYYPPDIGAGPNRVSDFAEGLSRKGHEVSVVCAFPHYPSGTVPKEYNGKFFTQEMINGVDVRRSWVYASPSKKTIPRLLNYFSFMLSAHFAVFLTPKYYDVCIISSPSPFPIFSVLPLKFLKFKKSVLEIRDVWPESAVAFGQMKAGIITKVFGWFMNRAYDFADLIIPVTYGQEKYFLDRGITKVATVTNGINEKMNQSAPAFDRLKFMKAQGITKSTKVALYVGSLGLAYDLKPVVLSFKQLPGWKLIIVGDGPRKGELEEFVKKEKISNVSILASVPKTELTKFLSISHVGILPGVPGPVFQHTQPSKMCDYIWYDLWEVGNISDSMRILFEKVEYKKWVSVENGDWLSAFKQVEKKWGLKHRPKKEIISLGARLGMMEQILNRLVKK